MGTGVFYPVEKGSGNIEVSTWYADNEPYLQVIEIQLSPHDWSEIQGKGFYQDLIRYLDSLKNQGNMQNQHAEINSMET